jgi:hypothetical protein
VPRWGAARAQLQAREDAPAGARTVLTQREDGFAQARGSVHAALAPSQQARDAGQGSRTCARGQRVRIVLDDEIKRLTGPPLTGRGKSKNGSFACTPSRWLHDSACARPKNGTL